MLNFAWILFEVSGDKKSAAFLCVHCEEEEEEEKEEAEYDGQECEGCGAKTNI